MNSSNTETPYQIALRDHPPISCGTRVRFRSLTPGNTGEVVGRISIYENNIFQRWTYVIVPFGMTHDNGVPMMTLERPENEVELI